MSQPACRQCVQARAGSGRSIPASTHRASARSFQPTAQSKCQLPALAKHARKPPCSGSDTPGKQTRQEGPLKAVQRLSPHRILQRPQPAAGTTTQQQDSKGGPSAWRRALAFQQWSPRSRGLFLLNTLVLLCASNWVVLKASNSQFDPFTFSLLRFSVAALAFWPFLKGADTSIWKAGCELGVWSGIAYLLQAEGILTTDASRASFLSAFTVIVVPILCGLSGRGVKPATWLSALVAFGGMGLLEHGGAPAGVGDLLSLLSALFFGIQVFRTEHHSRDLGPSASLPLMAVVLLTILSMTLGAEVVTHADQAAAVALHPGNLGKALSRLTLQNLFPIVWTGICSTDAVLLIEVLALQDVESTTASLVYSLEPVAGAALAWGFLGERWTGTAWLGALLILGSSIAAQLLNSDESIAVQKMPK